MPALPGRVRKHYIPLESNPDVFNELSHKLGLDERLEFVDVLSLNDPDLLAFVPRPALALVLVFPTTEAYEARVKEQDSERNDDAQPGGDVAYFKQTVNNACGLYALLHAVCNGEAKDRLTTDSVFDKLRKAALSSSMRETAIALEDNQELEQAYAEVAQKGDTEAPRDPEDEVPYHYVCFVKSHETGHLHQLDGDRKGPIDLGPMEATEDVLSDKCLDVIRAMMASESGDLHFSLMALVQTEA